MSPQNRIAESVRHFIIEKYRQDFKETQVAPKDDPLWKGMAAWSVLWLDTGDINAAAALWNTSFSALTTNNTLLNSEVQKGIYDRLIPEAVKTLRAAEPGIDRRNLVREIAFILNAVHGLRLADRFSCDVSVELHTDFAHDVESSVECALRFHEIDPRRFIVKLPLTPSGLIAVRRLSDRGIRVNFTLGFSARQNYVAALLAKPAFVNVFMGRLNAFVTDNKLGDGKNIGEKATLATLGLVRSLRKKGLSPTRLIGASIRNGAQIAAVAGTDVLTMPPKAAQQFHDANPLEIAVATAADLHVDLAQGIALSDFNGVTLWEMPDTFARCAETLAANDIAVMPPEMLQRHFEEAGFSDFLPRWSPEEHATATKDGKIPVFATWKEKLASGNIGLDALMNVSALCSFTADQKALDDRIEKHLD
jgi:transaldolase